MADYDNTNRGVLFKNDRKETDNHPDYNGKINIGGVDRYLSAWIKEGKNGKFMSLSLGKEVEQKGKPTDRKEQHNQAKANGYAKQPDFADDNLDDVPF